MGQKSGKTNSTASAEAAMPEPMPVKAAAGESLLLRNKTQAKETAPTAEPLNLPTKSWRALLQEQPLNADAKPFTPGVPQQASPSPAAVPSPTKLAASAPVPADADDPEWMQYLSKKLNAHALPPKPPPVSLSGGKGGQRRQGAGRSGGAVQPPDPDGGFLGRRGREQSVAEGDDEGPGGGGAVVIHTDAYLKLLKEGTTKKKVPTTNTTRRPGAKITPPLGKVGCENVESAMQGIPQLPDVPITTSSLVKKWSSAVNKKPGSNEVVNPAEEVVDQCTTQDDIWISKVLFDQDLSDPAYYSDTDPVDDKTSASMHRLGRRPKVATATIRTYVMQDLNYHLDQAVGMMLLRLQRFTDQQWRMSGAVPDPKRIKDVPQQRRFVIGLKEVARRTKQSKVECLIVAPDIEEDANSGGLDDRMRELLASAYQNRTPVIFALTRARLGKALGKSLHISVLGILDARGAQGFLDESIRLAGECQQMWLDRRAK